MKKIAEKPISAIDIFFAKIYILIITFPDCVMVALQILVLTVGVRILLGELKAEQLFQPFFVEFPYFTVFVWFLRLSV